jgi:uncharacterized protein
LILYLDTSALVKRYLKEPYSDEVLTKWIEATEIITSSVAYAETLASFYRKKREAGLKDTLIKKIADSFRTDWNSFIRVEVSDQLNEYIDRIIVKHPLRGFDTIHLASAMIMHERLGRDFVFACFDTRLANAAKTEGIETFPLNPDNH